MILTFVSVANSYGIHCGKDPVLHRPATARRTSVCDGSVSKRGRVAAEINFILAEEFCQQLLAPVVDAYENEKAGLLGDVS